MELNSTAIGLESDIGAATNIVQFDVAGYQRQPESGQFFDAAATHLDKSLNMHRALTDRKIPAEGPSVETISRLPDGPASGPLEAKPIDRFSLIDDSLRIMEASYANATNMTLISNVAHQSASSFNKLLTTA
ncbi:hypothetical protein AADZ90_007230 [Aestuariibius sp. 2305UL40-4]|uniref:hypothetical protein n=1 Tax=Aestuariibius violaceus TaxID=3234132 RepID=UPI00345EE089